MPHKSATSVPTFRGRWISARRARGKRRGSATISVAPRAWPFFKRVAATGWVSVMLVPMQKITSGLSMSARGFDMAPRPRVAARPATVGACHAREQLSTWLVWKQVRMSFWTVYADSCGARPEAIA